MIESPSESCSQFFAQKKTLLAAQNELEELKTVAIMLREQLTALRQMQDTEMSVQAPLDKQGEAKIKTSSGRVRTPQEVHDQEIQRLRLLLDESQVLVGFTAAEFIFFLPRNLAIRCIERNWKWS